MDKNDVRAVFEKKIDELIAMYHFGESSGDLHGCARTACTIAEILDLVDRLGLTLGVDCKDIII